MAHKSRPYISCDICDEEISKDQVHWEMYTPQLTDSYKHFHEDCVKETPREKILEILGAYYSGE